ncbi:MAG: hypothetical protein ACYC0V_08560, partial [Armatimonadota bacterium]
PGFEGGVPYSVFANSSLFNWTGIVSNGAYFCKDSVLGTLPPQYAHTGAEAASTALAKGHPPGSAELYQEVSISGDTPYTASVWAKGADYSGSKSGFGSVSGDSAELRISEYDAGGKLLGQHEAAIDRPTRDYTRLTATFMSHPDAIKVRFSLFGNLHTDEYKGRVLFDDCALEKADVEGIRL